MKVLSHLLSGQSFELILNAATGTGKLKAFATKLVRFNEANRQPGAGDPGKPANVRALLFDISFLMLCRIAQMYGTEVSTTFKAYRYRVLNHREIGYSEQRTWRRDVLRTMGY